MPSTRTLPRPAVLLGALCLLAAPPAPADSETLALISACADGNMDICQQIGGQSDDTAAATPLERRAMDFRDRAGTLELLLDELTPDLARGYDLVVRDYFSAESITDVQRERYFRAAALPECAAHYTEVWLHERGWWPTRSDGGPDWMVLYIHMLDHYFGYCAR